METFNNIADRENWPPGPWDDEPDRAEWVHDETGARCTVRRGTLGNWCGYVGVGENHPAHNRKYIDIDVEVHGGLTWGTICEPFAEDEWINYRIMRDRWRIDVLRYPDGDAARHLREDAKFDTSTLKGFQEFARFHSTCHKDCRHFLHWFGFDCGHGFDLVPGLEAVRIWTRHHSMLGPLPDKSWTETYRDFNYVVEQTNVLAVELFKLEVLK